MTQLDEIEARHQDGYGYENRESVMPLANALIDMNLLIRAVRQLEPYYKARGRFVVLANKPDPDVLELLEEA